MPIFPYAPWSPKVLLPKVKEPPHAIVEPVLILPLASPARLIIIFHVEPGGYFVCITRLKSGWLGSLNINEKSLFFLSPVNIDKSKSGLETRHSTSPFLGSTAMIAPLRLPRIFSAYACRSTSILSIRSSPFFGFMSSLPSL